MSYSDSQLEHMSICTSQYDSTCRELAAELLRTRKQLREEIRDMQRDARDAASEAYWKGVQGDDYGSY